MKVMLKPTENINKIFVSFISGTALRSTADRHALLHLCSYWNAGIVFYLVYLNPVPMGIPAVAVRGPRRVR